MLEFSDLLENRQNSLKFLQGAGADPGFGPGGGGASEPESC